jgi:hypothetical protein
MIPLFLFMSFSKKNTYIYYLILECRKSSFFCFLTFQNLLKPKLIGKNYAYIYRRTGRRTTQDNQHGGPWDPLAWPPPSCAMGLACPLDHSVVPPIGRGVCLDLPNSSNREGFTRWNMK